MRPPLNAGENTPAPRAAATSTTSFNEAPAERGGERASPATARARRRRFNEAPAERGGEPGAWRVRMGLCSSFNEAPAERGGELGRGARAAGRALAASMRPPLNAGENLVRRCRKCSCAIGFNEAPAERGGEQDALAPMLASRHRFNEAPAERGGERRRRRVPRTAGWLASMRPPLNAGENGRGRLRWRVVGPSLQ